MPLPSIDELKRVLTAAHTERRRAAPGTRAAALSSQAQATTRRRGVEAHLRSFFTKAGLDVVKLDQMLGQIQRDEREAFARLAAEAATHSARDQQALRHAIAERRRAIELLNTVSIIPPAGPRRIVLDRPFLIWQTPRLEESLVDSKIESLHSSVKVRINTNTGSDFTQFNFYFFWENNSDFFAVVNVDTSLILNGFCEIEAVNGIFSGDKCFLELTGQLSLLELWDQTSGQPAQPMFENSQRKTAASLDASGGGIFSSADIKSQMFINDAVDLSYSIFAVPGNSLAVFEVSLVVSFAFTDGGGDIADLIFVDFADDGANRSIICPSVNLELLTAPPGTNAQ
jgi:hypothetical protein